MDRRLAAAVTSASVLLGALAGIGVVAPANAVTLTVSRATITKLTLNKTSPQPVGTTVVLTAAVTNHATGTVQFSDGGKAMGSPQTLPGSPTNNKVTLSQIPAARSHQYQAVYTPTPGNGFAGSTSNTVSFVASPASANLSATITGRAAATVGQHIIYTVTSTNGGPDAAQGGFNLLLIPVDSTVVTKPASCTTGTTTVSGQPFRYVYCPRTMSLASGQHTNFQATVTYTNTGAHRAYGYTKSNTPDPSTANNVASKTTAISSTKSVWAWGYGGALGNGNTISSAVPVAVSGLTGVTAIAAGGYDGYALRSDGTAWAWGDGSNGALGNGGTTGSDVPVQVSGLTGVTAIAGGYFTGYALRSDGTVWAWGKGRSGALGNGGTTDSDVPVQVSGLTGVTAIAGGDVGNGYALRSDGTVCAWGYGAWGALGNGGHSDSTVPVQVSGLTDVTAIAGGRAAYALRSNGIVWAWGYGSDGELGNGGTNNSDVPVQVNDLTGVTAIAGGYENGYALRSDGTVWAWGYGSYGALGDDDTSSSDVPVPVSDLTGVTAIAGGGYDGYALRSDGTVWDWGDGRDGKLGNGGTTNSDVPVQVNDLTGVTAIAGGNDDGYAVR